MTTTRKRPLKGSQHPALAREIRFLRVGDVMAILGISENKAYQIISQMNRELREEGYQTISGRVSEARFFEKFYRGQNQE